MGLNSDYWTAKQNPLLHSSAHNCTVFTSNDCKSPQATPGKNIYRTIILIFDFALLKSLSLNNIRYTLPLNSHTLTHKMCVCGATRMIWKVVSLSDISPGANETTWRQIASIRGPERLNTIFSLHQESINGPFSICDPNACYWRRVMAFQKETIIDFSEVRKCPPGTARANEIMHDPLITWLNKWSMDWEQ